MVEAWPLHVPRYGERSLADLAPSALGALGVAGESDIVGIGPASRVCILVVDGLGEEQRRGGAGLAPFLAAHAREPLTASFPATTAASLSSIGTGLPPGEHGLVGYTMAVPGRERVMNVLRWELYGHGPHVDMRGELPPERLQPVPTALERAARAGVSVSVLGPREHQGSGMTRAALRGGRYRPVFGLGDLVAGAAQALAEGTRSLVYAYHADLDLIGHVRGAGSEAWRLQLRTLDSAAAALAERLPPGAALVVTGDHGMVDVGEGDSLDVDDIAGLGDGVAALAGEPRMRHVHAVDGAAGDVLAAWRDTLGELFWVAPRDEAIAGGWFGPRVPDRVRARIGDVIAASRGRAVLVQRAVDPLQASLRGHHGSATDEEQSVPLVVARRD
ncbi:MAG TPA: nucleotide pyrophosphatase/phosphodiesterase family protein [Candidatus Dormibacteraeota bacterium]|nr:nucleotide pyrophosphatase/phosphodiesterase family protein [Candidatus Dormibacteraeota bacterium]